MISINSIENSDNDIPYKPSYTTSYMDCSMCYRTMDSRVDNEKLELSLKWNNFRENIVSCLESSYGDQDFVDVTLACEGGSIKAHRLILSASSLYLRRVLKVNK